MDHSKIKGYFILVILIFACIMIFCQCECLHCKCKCKCKKKNRITVSPVEIRNNEIVVIGVPVNAFDINREDGEPVETIVVDVIR